jgi:hypothetical protein
MPQGVRGTWTQTFVVGFVALLCGALPSGAQAAEVHAFDPVLSLTGSCKESTLDPIPDPGICPMPPGVPGVDHPKTPISSPKAVATDFYGNIYVASYGAKTVFNPEGFPLAPEGRIVIFDSSGHYISEIADESGTGALAIDSEGNLYVSNTYDTLEEGVVRYQPTLYNPAAGEIEYGDPPVVLLKGGAGQGLAINRANDHLFRKQGFKIVEYKSAAEGNEEVETFGEGQLRLESNAIAVDAAHGRIYAGTWLEPENRRAVRVFELASPHKVLCNVEGADVPAGEFQSSFLSAAADEGTGHFFIYDGNGKKVYEFEQNCKYLATIERGFQYTSLAQIGVDNGANSPNGALNPFGRYLYVPSGSGSGGGSTGHSYAFGPENIGDPKIESTSVANVGEEEAELKASIEPFGLPTEYVFEYLTTQQYEEQGETFEGAEVAGEGTIPAGNSPIEVAAAIEELEPETRYRFRVFAENSEGSDEAEGEFATYPEAEVFGECPNEALRSGFSALLPDCRAYELVTPPDTNARYPLGLTTSGAHFATRKSSPGGGALSFVVEGGLIPGSGGTGSLFGDPYLSTRGASGWETAIAGPSGSEVGALLPGSNSPDQGYSFWTTGGPEGSAVIEGKNTSYVRYPDGHSALVGRGSLGTDPQAVGKLISESGTHIVFVSGGNNPAIQLEPNAPPSGTTTVYDRTADEVTHVVSLLPGEETPAAGEDATYAGASLDGAGVAFKIAGTLYLRFNDEETYELGAGATAEGIAEGGARAFYLKGGDLFRFDATTKETTPFSTSGDVTPVNVSADGSTAYFVSPSVLGEENPNGEVAEAGKENLYRSREGQISFVGTVTERDVKGEDNGNELLGGLGLWAKTVGEGRLAADPSRTTPNGGALLFESRADLAGYDPEGHAEVYRYDFSGNELNCLSCNPTLAPASSDASLQSISAGLFEPEPLTSFGYTANLRADGARAFFQSDEALVPGDVDGQQDVYEWEAKGTGSCERPEGCIYLVSSGHSLRIDYLYAASDSGDDVFFRTSDVLLPRDAEETPSIYDARVNGGFAEPLEEPCEGEGCKPGVTPGTVLPTPGMLPSKASGNLSGRACPKGKRKVKRHGKVVCVKKKKHHKKHHHKQAGKSKGAGK